MALSAEVLSAQPYSSRAEERLQQKEVNANYLERPRQLLGGVWLVGGEHKHESTANSYLVEANGKHILIDPGSKEMFNLLQRNLHMVGVLSQKIDAILVTHGHQDHIGALESFQQLGLEVPAYVPEKSVPYIERADPERTAAYLYNAPFPHITQYKVMSDHEVLIIGGSMFRFISTPGHSPDQMAVQLVDTQRNVVFPGDGLWGGQSEEVDSDTPQGRESLGKLIDLGAQAYLPGHADLFFRPHTVDTLQRAHKAYGKTMMPSFGNMISPWA
jgi:glyoxylase-like metal-dependent hydrolase (beta-lactamase superfamily II)